ncbi:hypothetical protein Tco_1532917 [Tanacetum coccineum]
MGLANYELAPGKNHSRNGEWINITMRKVYILLSIDEDSDWQTYLKYISIDLKFVEEQRLNLEQISNQKKKILRGEQLTESSSKNDVKENPFIPASLDYDHEMVPKSKDWVERHNIDSKLPNFNTERIIVSESQAVNECLKLTEATTDPESAKESGSESLTPLPPLKILKELLQALSKDHRTLDHDMWVASLKSSKNYKAQPYQYASPAKQILKAKAKPYPPCTNCGFNDHHPDDLLAESSQSSESSISVSCTTCGSNVLSITGHNDFKHFKRGQKIQATQAREPTKSGCSRSMTDVKSYLHKYVEKPGPKVVFDDNSSYITEGYGSINCGGICFSKVAFVNGLKYILISTSQLCDAKNIIRFDDMEGTIFNATKEIMLIAPRRNDVYVLDMSSLTPNGVCFFAKAPKSVNWLWH